MPKCAWILIAALAALLVEYPAVAVAAGAVVTAVATSPFGQIAIAVLAARHLYMHRRQPAGHPAHRK